MRPCFSGNVLFKTQNGGNSWQVTSPDLSRESWDIPASVGIYKNDIKKMPRRGVIYTIAPSTLNINTIWAGTDDGLIHITKDGGKTWKNVTPPGITSWSKISLVEAGHFDVNTAYAAVNRLRCDDLQPYIYKTNDGGKTWKKIVNGLANDPINAVKEDPKKKGLLFASSETQAYVSFDDGGNWQSLRLNMPATSVRDLIIKDNDLVVATHGRGFWILDNINSLRQINSNTATRDILFSPGNAVRVRWNMNTDTPLPPDEPAGQNPPDGAILDYYLKNNTSGSVVLEIIDAKGNVVRHYNSDDTLYKIPQVDIPLYWIRPQQILSAKAGSHRLIWDLHYQPLNIPPSYPIAAIYKNTAPEPTSPWVMPGNYIVKLSVNGRTFTEPLKVNMDPRVKTPLADLEQQEKLSLLCYNNRKQISNALKGLENVHKQIKELLAKVKDQLKVSLNDLDKKISSIENSKAAGKKSDLNQLYNSFASLFKSLQESDMPVMKQALDAVNENEIKMKEVEQTLTQIRKIEIPGLNNELKKEGLEPIVIQ
ncbi:MAG: hypothetical protein M3R50_09230 [Bacteroidota bacterium]|nr:hypothetical protein [Bacteroidota bacterium]